MSQSQGIEVRRPSRRTIAKGAAWAVPVIAIGASAPAFAASGGICIPEFSFASDSCKCPGQSTDQSWGYYLSICVNPSTGCDITGDTPIVWIKQIENNSGKALVPASANLPLLIPLGDCSSTLLFLSSSSASSIRFEYSIDGGSTYTWSDYISAPPDCEQSGSGNAKECLPPPSYPG